MKLSQIKILFATGLMGVSVGIGQACSPFKAANLVGNISELKTEIPTVPEPEPEPVEMLDAKARGAKLYATNCAACHNALASSQKLDRSAEQIQSARVAVSQMKIPGIEALTAGDLADLAAALRTTTSSPQANPFACDANAKPAATRLQRLAKSEYQNTLRDLFGGVVSVSDLREELAQVPEESNQENPFDRGADSMSLGLVKAQNNVAIKIASLVTTDTTRMNQIFTETCLTASTVTDACLNTFLDRFGTRAYRRPVKSAERAPLLAAYKLGTSRTESSAFLLRALLMSPNFLYHLEYDGTAADAQETALNLSAYELASRLSYLVLNSMPDAALLAAAANDSLLTSSVYDAQMSRLLTLPGAKTSLRRFFYIWFELNRMHDPVYTTAFKGNLNLTNLNVEALEEALLFSDHVVFEGKRLQSLLTDNTAFIKSQTLATLYGVSLPSSIDGRTTLPANERAGLLTRIARTASGSDNTSPILRGVAVRRSLLCDSLQAPDPSSLPPGSLNPPAEDPTLSTRQRFENKTSGAACVGCHSKINPIGYALEGFDALGRARTTEKILNAAGQVTNQYPINDVAIVDLSQPPNPEVRGGIALSETIAQSQKFPACFAQRWFQFSMRRKPAATDNCLLASTYEVLKNPNATLLDTIKAATKNPEFKIRRMK
jgi:mono/diheme cytochrome c family protein